LDIIISTSIHIIVVIGNRTTHNVTVGIITGCGIVVIVCHCTRVDIIVGVDCGGSACTGIVIIVGHCARINIIVGVDCGSSASIGIYIIIVIGHSARIYIVIIIGHCA
jgi:hypothetical protein